LCHPGAVDLAFCGVVEHVKLNDATQKGPHAGSIGDAYVDGLFGAAAEGDP
jgi:hypothetical protein